MDLKPFKLDIDELINEFIGCESTAMSAFKRVWLSKKFSFIFEACPSTNQGFFMQSLYAHCIGYLVSAGSFTNRLGGIYCLYCLYETQPFKPRYRIYLSIGELRQIKNFVVDAKAMGVEVVSVLLKTMLERNVFLFGYVGVNEGSATERVNELTGLQDARIQAAYKKLFADSRLEHFIHMDMGTELDVDLFKKKSSDYAAAKALAIKEASQVVDIKNIKHIAENKRLIGDILEKSAADWKSQKEMFYEQTRLDHHPPPHQNGSNLQIVNGSKEPFDDSKWQEASENDQDNFGKELEEALLFDPFDEAEPPVDSTEYTTL